jgi:DHA3 family macrolide efflux protein-like MFS transporter
MTNMTDSTLSWKNWKPRFFTIWTGQAFSLLGSSLVQFALIWWLTTTTGSATVLATATLAGMLPQIVLAPFAGVIVDRTSRRVVMLAADGVTALATLVLTVLFFIGAAQPWHVYVIMFIRSAGGAFHFPAMQASTTLMVPDKHLSRVAGMNQTLQGLMSIGAPPLGALLVSVWPIQQVLLIDAFTALMAILPLLFIAIPQPKRIQERAMATAPQTSFGQDLREGLRYVAAWRGLTILIFMAMAINFLLTPGAALTPILVTKHFGGAAPQMAAMEATWGIGMILGGALLTVWGGFKRRIITSLMGVTLIGAFFVLTGLLPPTLFGVALALSVLLGAMNPITNGPLMALFQSTIAPEMQGRVMSLLGAGSSAMTPLSLLVAGPVADAVGVQTWYVVGGLLCAVIGIAGFFIPTLMKLEEQKARHTAVTAEPVTVSAVGEA